MAGVAVPLTYPVVPDPAPVARETGPPAPRPPRLLDRVREAVRARHYSRRTENQALSALPFLYRAVLAQDLPWLDDVVRAKRKHSPT